MPSRQILCGTHRKALKNLLKGTYGEILTTSPAAFVQFDESAFKMNGRKGYVWLVTVEDATYLVAAPSRAAAVRPAFWEAARHPGRLRRIRSV